MSALILSLSKDAFSASSAVKPMATAAFWVLLLVFMGAFAAQVARRVRIIAAAPNTFSLDQPGFRVRRFLLDVVLQRQTIKERPFTGIMHAFVFWGFVAFEIGRAHV